MAKPRKKQSKQSLIASLARGMGVDPKAALAVASVEGGFGGAIGDRGTSFGPFQLHIGGALPRGVSNPQAWANSPSGIRYALAQIAKVSRGLQGRAAIDAIVRKFERPAAPDAEVIKALGRYGSIPSGGMWTGAATDVPFTAPGTRIGRGLVPNPDYTKARRHALTQALFNDEDIASALASVNVPKYLPQAQAPSPQTPSFPVQQVRPGGTSFRTAELFYDPLGAYKFGQSIAPIGGHSDHVHAAFQNAQATIQAIRLAQSLGLRVSENPYVDPVDPVHVKNSYHYRTFPGQYNGRRVGEAFDASGSPQAMATLFRRLRPRG